MTLPASGAIGLFDVNTELGFTNNAQIGMLCTSVRTLFGDASDAVSMFDGYGKSNTSVPGAPTGVSGSSPTSSSVSVSFSAPSCTGHLTIDYYQAISSPGCITATGTSPISVTGLSPSTSYTFRVRAHNSKGYGCYSSSSGSVSTTAVRGCATYTTPGTYTWYVPAGVTSVSAMAVGAGGQGGQGYSYYCCCNGFTVNVSGQGGGGGGLAYTNNYSVVSSFQINASSAYSMYDNYNSRNAVYSSNGTSYQPGSGYHYGSGYGCGFSACGGAANRGYGANVYTASGGGGVRWSGSVGNNGLGGSQCYGNGAAGFAGINGGSGGGGSGPKAPSGRGAAGGGGGGGVGIYGQTSSSGSGGAAMCGNSYNNSIGAIVGGGGGGGGSGGNNGSAGTYRYGGAGGSYGGGGGGSDINFTGANGGVGFVRIVWPGNSRSWPSTDVGA